MTKSERVPAATMLLLLIAAWAPYALGFGTAPMGLSRSALGSSRSALVTRVGDGSRRIPAIFGGSRDALARRTGGLFRQPESSGLKLRMTLGDEESRDTTSLNDLAANKAMQLLLSRRHMIGASAAAAAAASISRPTSASAAAAAQAGMPPHTPQHRNRGVLLHRCCTPTSIRALPRVCRFLLIRGVYA
jgi:hypothetical protein